MGSLRERDLMLALVRAGLWEKPVDAGPFRGLTEGGWLRVWDMARRQAVAGLTYAGVCRLRESLLPPDRLLFRFAAEADRTERRSLQVNAAVNELYALFARHGLRPVLLKGQAVAQYYERPLLREAGDIDLCFPSPSDWEKAGQCVARAGLKPARLPDGSLAYQWGGVEVEHHPAVFDLLRPRSRRYLKQLVRAHGFVSCTGDSGSSAPARMPVSFTQPAPLLTLLLLNTHILKHALGRGVGLRQLCDLARAYHALMPQNLSGEYRAAVEALGLGRWTRLLSSFLVRHLGPEPHLLPFSPSPISPQALEEIVFGGGNFGRYRNGGMGGRLLFGGHKLETALTFIKNAPFAARFAPWDGTALFLHLICGQRRRIFS